MKSLALLSILSLLLLAGCNNEPEDLPGVPIKESTRGGASTRGAGPVGEDTEMDELQDVDTTLEGDEDVGGTLDEDTEPLNEGVDDTDVDVDAEGADLDVDVTEQPDSDTEADEDELDQ